MALGRRRLGAIGRGRTPQIRASTGWTRFGTLTATTVAAGTKVLLGFLTPTVLDLTVRRTRGMFLVTSDQSGTVEEQLGAFGIIKVNDLALAAGAASIPGPITDQNDEGWMVHLPIVQIGDTVPGGTVARGSTLTPVMIDGKAMRKVPEGYNLAIMVENAHATQGFEINFYLAFLSSSGYTPA